jgi:sigma-B regulation protein RsbU (phosphoserine phosphatase)
MYIRLTNNGDIKGFSSELLSFFNLNAEDLIYRNYFELIREDLTLSVLKRFRQKVLSSSSQLLVIPFEINSLINWVEWRFHEGIENEIIAIGKDITCIKKFEPIIKAQNRKLRMQNKSMMDSIIYAKQIQTALLPSLDLISNFENSFVIYKAKDVVSGDFYWFYKAGSQVFIISIDCTGHGVPGALMTVLVNALLNEIIKLDEVQFPHQILSLLDSKLTSALQANGKVIHDGLDIAVGLFDFDTKVLSFSGAFQNIQILSGCDVEKLAGERYPIGYYPYCIKNFKSINYQLKKGDRFYFYSDGILDQFGGQLNKKIGTKRLMSKLIATHNLDMSQQKKYILNFFNKWKGENEQIDDVLLMGFEV